jgi:hypothetical protein
MIIFLFSRNVYRRGSIYLDDENNETSTYSEEDNSLFGSQYEETGLPDLESRVNEAENLFCHDNRKFFVLRDNRFTVCGNPGV